MEEALTELKENEFKTLFEKDLKEPKLTIKEVQLDTDLEIMLPDHYVNIVKERLRLYHQLSAIKDIEELTLFEKSLEDRFGPLPDAAVELLASVQIKWVAAALGLERLVIKNGKCVGYFMAQENHPFYESPQFQNILMRIQEKSKQLQLKQKETRQGMRLLLLIDGIKNTATLLKLLHLLSHPRVASGS